MEEMLPCPFCGGEAEISYCEEGCCGAMPRGVYCNNRQCGLEFFCVTKTTDEEVVKEWNKRWTGEKNG